MQDQIYPVGHTNTIGSGKRAHHVPATVDPGQVRREGRDRPTGAGSGIGKATAVRLAQEGAKVIATDVSKPRLHQLTQEHPDLDLVTVAGDIARKDTIQAVVASAGGRVDTLANVAGIMDAFLASLILQ